MSACRRRDNANKRRGRSDEIDGRVDDARSGGLKSWPALNAVGRYVLHSGVGFRRVSPPGTVERGSAKTRSRLFNTQAIRSHEISQKLCRVTTARIFIRSLLASQLLTAACLNFD